MSDDDLAFEARRRYDLLLEIRHDPENQAAILALLREARLLADAWQEFGDEWRR